MPRRSARNLLGWFGHFFLGSLRTLVRGLTRGWTVGVPDRGADREATTAAWAGPPPLRLLTDLAMFAIGGKLKARGKLTGRYADALAWHVPGLLRAAPLRGRRPP